MHTQHLLEFVSKFGYPAIFTLYAAGIFGFPIPDETLLVFIGFLVSKGTLNYPLAMSSALLGICAGITVSYLAGLTGGAFVLQRFGGYLRLDGERLKKFSGWFDKYGSWSLVLGFYLPGIRHLTAVFAGSAKMKYRKFAFFTYPGAFLWVNAFLLLGGIIADVRGFAEELHEHSALAASLVACALLCAFLFWYINRIRGKGSSNPHKRGSYHR